MMRAIPLVVVALALAAAAPATATAAGSLVDAPSAIVVDASTGDALYRRADTQRRPIASTTKLMTALLTLERSKLSDIAPAARYRGLAIESKIGLRPGERLSVADLLRGLLVYSANDAAVTLAEHVSGSRAAFVTEMNRRAAQLGLRDTRFANPVGLDSPGNYSTAADLAKLTMALQRFPFFREVADAPSVTLKSGARPRTFQNRNQLVRRFPWISGVKTGHTQSAGWVLIGSGKRRGISLISVVLGTTSEAARNNDTLKLLQYGFAQYRRSTAVRRGQVVRRVPIAFRPGARLGLVPSRDVRPLVRRGTRPRLHLLDLPDEVRGPIRRGQRLATAEVFVGSRRVSRVPLIAESAVPEAGFGRRTEDWFTRGSTLLAAVGAIVLAALASMAARGRTPKGPQRRQEEVTAA
jgi:D-alanyl-D-alanine carboxypeptidase (penicillin-binding protein 5/6)